jgi:hypothetical protein
VASLLEQGLSRDGGVLSPNVHRRPERELPADRAPTRRVGTVTLRPARIPYPESALMGTVAKSASALDGKPSVLFGRRRRFHQGGGERDENIARCVARFIRPGPPDPEGVGGRVAPESAPGGGRWSTGSPTLPHRRLKSCKLLK